MTDIPIKLVCILGPTAAGKTRLAAFLAAAISGEVISVDSRQVYRYMDIGTGKDLADYVVDGQEVPYHLIDIVDPGYEYNVYEFKRDCVAAIRDIDSRGKVPVLCGGTGLYLSAVLQDYELRPAPPDPRRHDELESMTTDLLVAELSSRVPLHNTTDICDRERLIRAIEIAEAAPEARSPSVPITSLVYGMRWEPALLRERIARRLSERLEEGLIEEVRSLLSRGLAPERLERYGLEYRYVTEFICGEIDLETMTASLTRAIQKFAKRQRTWFRRMERQGVSVRWLEGHMPVEQHVNEISLDFANLQKK